MKTTSSTTAASLNSTYGPKGTVWIYRTNPVGQFSWGPGGNCPDADAAYAAATAFRAGHRRAERCSIWIQSAAEGSDMVELSAAGEAPPSGGKSSSGASHTRTKSAGSNSSDRASSRKERREKKKVDLLAIREHVKNAKFSVLGVEAIVDECAVVRREAFREVRARVSRVAACRITTWKAKGEKVVTVLGVEAFR